MAPRPHVSDAAARAQADQPLPPFRGHERSWDGRAVLIWDDVEGAEALAAELGTEAKHSGARFDGPWQSFSIVALPEEEWL
jgi:hypothetical protein